MIKCKECGEDAPAVEAATSVKEFSGWEQVSDKVGFCCNTIYFYKPSEFSWGSDTEVAIEVPKKAIK